MIVYKLDKNGGEWFIGLEFKLIFVIRDNLR